MQLPTVGMRRGVTIMAKGEDKFDQHYERRQEDRKRAAKNQPGEDEDPLPPPVDTIRKDDKEPGRNDPCPCGSGKKYKQCCLKK